jgi:hypothetical protein
MLFAPPDILCAYSYAVDGSEPEEPLPAGTHLRVFCGLNGVFPLAPFAVFTIGSRRNEPQTVHVTNAGGAPVGGGDLSQFGVLELTPVYGDTEERRTIRAELFAGSAGAIDEVQLLDSQRRVIAARREPEFVFSAPTLSRFGVRGDASWITLLNRTVDIDTVVSARAAADLLGLPITGLFPWYLGVHDRQRGLQRVEDGAPTLLNPMDQPDGGPDPVGADEEVARVEAMLAADRLSGGLERLVASIVGDDQEPPWDQVDKRTLDGSNQIAIVPRLGRMQFSALDPGLARFLGFAGRIHDLPDLERGEGWTVLAVVGLLAVDPALADTQPLLERWLKSPDPDEPLLVEMLRRALESVTGSDPAGDLDLLRDHARQKGLLARAAVAVTAPLPPWLAPTLPEPTITDHSWQTGDGAAPSSLYRATFTFPDAPLAAMAAVGANFDGTWRSRHSTVDVDGFARPTRAVPRLIGHESRSTSRVRLMLRAGRSAAVRAAGLLADEGLPGDAGTVTYRFWASDFFGRFGDVVETAVDPPTRPKPPPPVIRYELDLLQDDLEQLPAAGTLSPGDLRLTFAVPEAPPADAFPPGDEDALRSAIRVPGIVDLAAGSVPITSATVSFDGVPQPSLDLSAPGLFPLVLPLPELGPQEVADVSVAVHFTNSDGADSDTATVTLRVSDKRPLTPIETGVALFWTSAAGPAPDVQLQLTWQGAARSRYRVYATDRQGLGLTDADLHEHIAGAAPSRGRIAEVGCNKVLGGAPIDKKAFRLLDTVQADPAGRAVLRTTLSRSLEAVQFLRVVPLSGEGAEAPFDTCGIVPVAVPDSRRPPLPRLDGSVDPVTGVATLTVTADGFDEIALRRDEPGLFDPGAEGAVPPTFRIRRAVGSIADPIYGREVAHGELTHTDGVFRGGSDETNQGRGLEPFVEYVYWADVRLPPERRLPVGVQPRDGGFATLDPANAVDYPRPVSLPSAPRTLMRLPAALPAAPAEASITASKASPAVGDIVLTIQITDPPAAHARAIGPYRLAAWTQWPGHPIEAITNADGTPLDGALPELTAEPVTVSVAPPTPPGDANGALVLRVAFVDPAGRVGDLTTITVT